MNLILLLFNLLCATIVNARVFVVSNNFSSNGKTHQVTNFTTSLGYVDGKNFSYVFNVTFMKAMKTSMCKLTHVLRRTFKNFDFPVTFEVLGPSDYDRMPLVYDSLIVKQTLNLCNLDEALRSMFWLGPWIANWLKGVNDMKLICPFPAVSAF
jgi:hypothetical protein